MAAFHLTVCALPVILTLLVLICNRRGVEDGLSKDINQDSLVWRTHERRNLLVRGKVYLSRTNGHTLISSPVISKLIVKLL